MEFPLCAEPIIRLKGWVAVRGDRLSLLLAVTGGAFASTPINETRSVNADARIDVSNIKGDVTISGWDKNEVSITGMLGENVKKLAIDGSGSSLSIKVEPPDKQGWFNWGSESRMGNTSLDLKVPRNAEMKIEVVSADVAFADVAFGAAAGVANASGLGLLYHGLAHGRIGVVAPVTAVVGAIVPVAWALAQGERPSGIVLAGAACAHPPDEEREPRDGEREAEDGEPVVELRSHVSGFPASPAADDRSLRSAALRRRRAEHRTTRLGDPVRGERRGKIAAATSSSCPPSGARSERRSRRSRAW